MEKGLLGIRAVLGLALGNPGIAKEKRQQRRLHSVPMSDALSLTVDVIQDHSNKKRSKCAWYASVPSDSSRDSRRRSRHDVPKELRELRKFRDDAQAAAKARNKQMEKSVKEERKAQLKALEEKVMSSLPQGLKVKKLH